jgi:hypothetical protein
MRKPKTTGINWDGQSSPEFEDLQKALKPFRIFVYEDPDFEGSDMYGYIFSDRKLTRKDLKKMSVFNI